MNKSKSILILSCFLMITSCLQREDKVFGASDEIHYIMLFEENNDFEILYNSVNTAIGNYSMKGDTIFLTYVENQFKEFNPNDILTRKLLINKATKKVKSVDEKRQFCANIYLDELWKISDQDR